jgi:hypothetical protein
MIKIHTHYEQNIVFKPAFTSVAMMHIFEAVSDKFIVYRIFT